jgi:hypothetical protein
MAKTPLYEALAWDDRVSSQGELQPHPRTALIGATKVAPYDCHAWPSYQTSLRVAVVSVVGPNFSSAGSDQSQSDQT